MKKELYCAFIIALKEEYDVFCNTIRIPTLGCSNFEEIILVEKNATTFLINTRDSSLDCFALCVDGMGNIDSNQTVIRMLYEFNPKVVINLGIAGRYDDDYSLGDIIIAEEIDGYSEIGKIEDSKDSIDFKFAGKTFTTTYKPSNVILINSNSIKRDTLRSMEEVDSFSNEDIAENFVNRINSGDYNVSRAPIASGPFVSSSNNFKMSVLKKNRKLSCVEMEALGVSWACHIEYPAIDNIVLKTISDYADKDKKKLDNIDNGKFRSISMSNLTHFVIHSMVHLAQFYNSFSSSKKHKLEKAVPRITLQEYIRGVHINKKYSDLQFKNIDIKKYEALFRIIISGNPEYKNLFDQLVESILNDPSVLSAVVYGNKGVGKSSFMALLYLFIENKFVGDNNVSVLYFNISRSYEHRVYNQNGTCDYNRLAEDIAYYINQDKRNIILLFDGIDEAFFAEEDQKYNLYKKLKHELEGKHFHKVILGTNSSTITNKIKAFSFIENENPSLTLEIGNVHTKSSFYKDFVKYFHEIAFNKANNATLDDLFKYIDKFEVHFVDFFILSVLYHNLKDHTFAKCVTYSQFLETYCESILFHQGVSKLKEALLKEAEDCFHEIIFKDNAVEHSSYTGKLGNHITILNFLLSKYFTYRILCFDQSKNLDVFKYVFNDEFNTFVKQQINENKPVSQKAFKNLKMIYSEILNNTKDKTSTFDEPDVFKGLTYVCYLIGRISNPALKSDAIEFLTEAKSYFLPLLETDEKLKNIPDYGLLIRSIFISLSYLGDEKQMHLYVDRLFSEPSEDDLNRGFHREYYGDKEWRPADSMNHADDGGDCTKTLTHISEKISKYRIKSSRLIEIEIHTFLSLIQHRHQTNRLPISKADAQTMVGDLIDSQIIKHEKLKAYARFVLKNLTFTVYNPFHLLTDLYRLKQIERTGWVESSIKKNKRLESVAEHTLSCCLIALLYLKENGKEANQEYKRSRVIEILMNHDLPEAFLGDIKQKTESERLQEREWAEYIGLTGTYDGMPSSLSCSTAYDEYERRSTVNGSIARDIDKLDAVIQAFLYFMQDVIPRSKYEEFVNTNLKEIKTDTVKSIVNKFKEYIILRESDGFDIFWSEDMVPALKYLS